MEDQRHKYTIQQNGSASSAEGFKLYSPVNAMRRYIDSLPQETSCKEELRNPKFWKSLRVEFLGTFLFIIFGCGACMDRAASDPSALLIVELKVSLIFGLLSTLVMFLSSGPLNNYQSCHLNPAITLSLFLIRELSAVKLLFYFFVQLLASLSAAVILYGLVGFGTQFQSSDLGSTLPLATMSPSNIFGFEFLGTFLVVLTYLSVSDAKQNIDHQTSYFKYIYVGFAMFAAHLFAFRYTGASFNPIRSLGPAVVANKWTHHWIYWIGPLLGGMLAGFTYEYIRSIKCDRTSERVNPTENLHQIGRDISMLSTEADTGSTDINHVRF